MNPYEPPPIAKQEQSVIDWAGVAVMTIAVTLIPLSMLYGYLRFRNLKDPYKVHIVEELFFTWMTYLQWPLGWGALIGWAVVSWWWS